MDVMVGEEVSDVKIMTVEIEGDKTIEETSVMTDMTIGKGVEQEKEVSHQGEMTVEDMIVQMQI